MKSLNIIIAALASVAAAGSELNARQEPAASVQSPPQSRSTTCATSHNSETPPQSSKEQVMARTQKWKTEYCSRPGVNKTNCLKAATHCEFSQPEQAQVEECIDQNHACRDLGAYLDECLDRAAKCRKTGEAPPGDVNKLCLCAVKDFDKNQVGWDEYWPNQCDLITR
ncbi:uncharacterized protein MAM_07330 [Metarhizium album ARSEF 1941]|uniref:Uncharacterized protein n=1 Tax=Metarhizium album (strain ARSEF 1941) TaxID=1081103 RepID=A0A0B2WM68_METAS|nr:uncharacterized protein MAM_07330 [Metarhizium album ARSEF 1941]KHN94734.1 hypothetical protein MAM_07330 [Metarhizium album ARSEF 1941]